MLLLPPRVRGRSRAAAGAGPAALAGLFRSAAFPFGDDRDFLSVRDSRNRPGSGAGAGSIATRADRRRRRHDVKAVVGSNRWLAGSRLSSGGNLLSPRAGRANDIEDRFWVFRHDPQKNPGAAFGFSAPLFPVAERRWADTHERSEFRLAQPATFANSLTSSSPKWNAREGLRRPRRMAPPSRTL